MTNLGTFILKNLVTRCVKIWMKWVNANISRHAFWEQIIFQWTIRLLNLLSKSEEILNKNTAFLARPPGVWGAPKKKRASKIFYIPKIFSLFSLMKISWYFSYELEIREICTKQHCILRYIWHRMSHKNVVFLCNISSDFRGSRK